MIQTWPQCLTFEWVSVINNLKGTKECRNKQLLLGRRINNSKNNVSVVKTPQFCFNGKDQPEALNHQIPGT